jgi:hypothetical protein
LNFRLAFSLCPFPGFPTVFFSGLPFPSFKPDRIFIATIFPGYYRTVEKILLLIVGLVLILSQSNTPGKAGGLNS